MNKFKKLENSCMEVLTVPLERAVRLLYFSNTLESILFILHMQTCTLQYMLGRALG